MNYQYARRHVGEVLHLPLLQFFLSLLGSLQINGISRPVCCIDSYSNCLRPADSLVEGWRNVMVWCQSLVFSKLIHRILGNLRTMYCRFWWLENKTDQVLFSLQNLIMDPRFKKVSISSSSFFFFSFCTSKRFSRHFLTSKIQLRHGVTDCRIQWSLWLNFHNNLK